MHLVLAYNQFVYVLFSHSQYILQVYLQIQANINVLVTVSIQLLLLFFFSTWIEEPQKQYVPTSAQWADGCRRSTITTLLPRYLYIFMSFLVASWQLCCFRAGVVRGLLSLFFPTAQCVVCCFLFYSVKQHRHKPLSSVPVWTEHSRARIRNVFGKGKVQLN